MSIQPTPQEPPLYHQEDIAYVMNALSEGACCSIVGMSNIGKSHLLRSLRRAEVRQQFLGSGAEDHTFVYVDFNLMWEMTDQGFYEVILRGITSQIDSFAISEQAINRVRQSYQNVINPSSPFLIPVSFNEGLLALSSGWNRRLVLLFDEFDEPWMHIDRRAYLNLRALRDHYQENLCYVTATTRSLPEIRTGREIGEFCELFTHHTRYLAPLAPAEVRHFVHAFGQRENICFDEADIRFILGNADGHPGFLENVCAVLAEVRSLEQTPNYERLQERLDSDPDVRTECAKLWNDLAEDEQEALIALTTGKGTSEKGALASLQRKHILAKRDGECVPFCRLFAGFARRQHLVRHRERRGVRVDAESGDVWVDGQLLPSLTELEYRLLLLLYGNLNKICDKYKVVEAVWGEGYIDEVDDARIEKLISRVRQKLGEDPEEPRHLITVRGRGYKLVGPEV